MKRSILSKRDSLGCSFLQWQVFSHQFSVAESSCKSTVQQNRVHGTKTGKDYRPSAQEPGCQQTCWLCAQARVERHQRWGWLIHIQLCLDTACQLYAFLLDQYNECVSDSYTFCLYHHIRVFWVAGLHTPPFVHVQWWVFRLWESPGIWSCTSCHQMLESWWSSEAWVDLPRWETLPELQDDFVIAVGAHPAFLSVLNQASMVTKQWAEGWCSGGTRCLNHFQMACLFFEPEIVCVCSLLWASGYFVSSPFLPHPLVSEIWAVCVILLSDVPVHLHCDCVSVAA